MFDNKVILVTGGTGSFGHEFTQMLLRNYSPRKLIILSRDEMKQWEMRKLYEKDARVRFLIGDVRDKDRLKRAFYGVDFVVHAAATKIVPTAEYEGFECVKTNVFGAMNVIDAAIDCGVSKVVALSTDKASSPINLYGATKLTSDRLFISANAYAAGTDTKFSVVRYGNVMGSRGSVIPFFMKIASGKPLPITDFRMTRYMVTLPQAVEAVWLAFTEMHGGEIFVSKVPSMKVVDVATAINHEAQLKEVGIRPGEKLHEQMVGTEDAQFTFDYGAYYKILSPICNWYQDEERIGNGKPVSPDFFYRSDTNEQWMTKEELSLWIDDNKLKIGIV